MANIINFSDHIKNKKEQQLNIEIYNKNNTILLIKYVLLNGYMIEFIKSLLNEIIGNYDKANKSLKIIIDSLLKYKNEIEHNKILFSVMLIIYTRIVKNYLKNYDVESAVVNIINSCGVLKISELPGIPMLNNAVSLYIKSVISNYKLLDDESCGKLTITMRK